MKEQILTRAKIVTRSDILDGSLKIVDGRIESIDTGPSRVPGAEDLQGDYLLPGLIEMHTDGIERHLHPRPGVIWPSGLSAVLAHDAQIIGAGITTVLDAVAVGDFCGDEGQKPVRRLMLDRSIQAIETAKKEGLFRSDHLLHLRCEVSDPEMVELFDRFAGGPHVRLLSIMDHTPGQRQWSDINLFRKFYQHLNWTDRKMHRIITNKIDFQDRFAVTNSRHVIDFAHDRSLPLASHDDTTAEHVMEAASQGFTFSEFPTTLEAARQAGREGMAVVMGAPNLVRGKSHSGNASARELAENGLLNVLSSDYAPNALLHSAFLLHLEIGLPLPEAVNCVSANVADKIGLTDRGQIAPGRKADLIRVRLQEDLPVVRRVWRDGQPIY